MIACLTAPLAGHTVLFGMSDNTTTWWDNRHAAHIGYGEHLQRRLGVFGRVMSGHERKTLRLSLDGPGAHKAAALVDHHRVAGVELRLACLGRGAERL